MKLLLLKASVLGAAVFCLMSMTSCTYDVYGNPYGTAYSSYTYSNYPYGYTTTSLPYGYSSIYLGGTRYWHCNNHYYRHYPGRGYVVVKRPPGHVANHRPAYRQPVRHSPTKYTNYNGNRYVYQNRPTHAHRGTVPQVAPSTRQGNVTYPNRYSTVRTSPASPRTVQTQPVNVQPRSAPATSSSRTKTRPPNQSSTWKSNSSGGGSTIHRNPSGRSTSSHSGMSSGGGSRGGASSGGGRRGRF